ncbi:metal-dependent transcriptional regulator [Demequina sp.]|uniref:metal-dependent transcriptional regulator n=1 Tax=Demequina sp. TaxID=2050685 RepID=UPI003D103BB5
MTDLIDTTEMYLRTIYELREDGVVPMRARISEHLGHAGPTVSQTVARMERDGLVVVDPTDRHLELTAEGELIATRVMRKHRLAERLLTDVIGLELAFVHEEACRWEHVMSERVERRVVEMIEGPLVSPYGNPVPGLDDLGVARETAQNRDEVPISEVFFGEGTVGVVTRIGETPQAEPEFLAELANLGVLPGNSVSVRAATRGIEITGPGGSMTITEDDGRHVFVALD